jgi:hypothetical protein
MAPAALLVVVLAWGEAAKLAAQVGSDCIANRPVSTGCHVDAEALERLLRGWTHPTDQYNVGTQTLDELGHRAGYVPTDHGIGTPTRSDDGVAVDVDEHESAAVSEVPAHLRFQPLTFVNGDCDHSSCLHDASFLDA